MRIKEILYIFISKETENSIIEKHKSLLSENQTYEYQLSCETETLKFNNWISEKDNANNAIRKLKCYMPETELIKVIKEFEKMGQIIRQYGKTSLYDLNKMLSPESNKYSHENITEKNSFSGEIVFRYLIEKINSKKNQLEWEIRTSSNYIKLWKKTSYKHPLIEFLDELNSLLFISTFPEKDTGPILKKIKNL